MKDGRTHLAHKAEHAVDLETGAVVAVTIQPADQGDTETVKQTLINSGRKPRDSEARQLRWFEELVTDKGYHSNELLKDLRVLGIRTYISEPARGRRNWQGNDPDARDAVYANRRRIRWKREADGCCVSAVNVWSVLSPMRTKREDFVGCTCAAAQYS